MLGAAQNLVGTAGGSGIARGQLGLPDQGLPVISLGTQGTITGLSHGQLASVTLQASRYLQLPPGLQNH